MARETKTFHFECRGCNEPSQRDGGKCPTWCEDCSSARVRFVRVFGTNKNYPSKECNGCGVHMSNLDYGNARFCAECTVVRTRRHDGWADPYAAKPRYLNAANDNKPGSKTRAMCEWDLPFEAFTKTTTGLSGCSSECRECRAIIRANRGREAEYERQKILRYDPVKEAAKASEVVRRRKMQLCDKWNAKRVAQSNRIKAYVDRFYLVQKKPWLANGLTGSARDKLRRLHDPIFLILERTRSRLKRKGVKGDALKAMRRALNAANDNSSSKRTMQGLLGFTADELKSHLERQFTDGMSWDRFRDGDIHIDHIRPLNTFDLSDHAQAAMAWSLVNLRPLWAIDNMKRPRDGRDVEWPEELRAA